MDLQIVDPNLKDLEASRPLFVRQLEFYLPQKVAKGDGLMSDEAQRFLSG